MSQRKIEFSLALCLLFATFAVVTTTTSTMKRLLLTALHLIIFVSLQAETTIAVHHFSVRDGLPANAITSVKQDSHGLIWIATWNGLCCYDGYQFTTFRSDPWGTDNALSTSRISAIQPDSKDNIWVRTYDGGLYLLDTERCQFFNVGELVKKHFGEDIKPRNIYCLKNGHTWVTDEGEQMNIRIDDSHPLDMEHVEVWGKKGKAINGTFIRKVEEDAKGQEWIVTDLGMMRYGTKEFRKDVFTNYPNGDNSQPDSQGEAYAKEHNVGKHLVDKQGNLWYWSAHGLSLVRFQNSPMQLLPLADAGEVRSLLCSKKGTVWVGTRSGVLAIFDGSGQPAGHKDIGVPIYSLLEDSDGHIWVGTRGNGIYIYSADGAPISHYTHDANNPYSLSNDDIYDIDQDEQGNIWIATWGGGVNLVRTKRADVQFIHKGNELKSYPKEGFDKVRRITHNGKGIVLASTTWGLMTFPSTEKRNDVMRFYTTIHEAGDTTSLQTSDVMQTLVSKKGTIFVATMGGGIQQVISTNLLQKDLQLRLLPAMNQGAGNALSMTEDQEGNIWIFRESEVNRYMVKSRLLERFDISSIGNMTELTEAETIIDGKGHLWLGTTEGVLTFDSRQMNKSKYLPRIIFTGILYQGEQEPLPLLHRRMLDIEDKAHRDMIIRFAALDYDDNYLMQYAYCMDDDGEWNYLGSTPRISFSQIPPGTHKLTVRSTNSDGVWVDNDTTLTIYVEPTLWERGWFRALIILLIIGLATWSIIRYLQHRQHNKEREQRLQHIMQQYKELQERMENEQQTAITMVSEAMPVREYKLSEPEVEDPDEVMMNKLMAFIKQRISDEELKIDDMADAVGLGRTVFYGKIKELVGLSPSDFLKQIRMERATQLIRKSKMTFSEIAYAVGFTDPKYFTKCFKKQTGMTPSECRAQEEIS